MALEHKDDDADELDWADDLEVPFDSRTHASVSAADVVRMMIAAHLEVDLAAVELHHELHRDLGLTPLGVVLIGLDLEDLEQVTLPFELLSAIDTVEQLGRFLSEARLSSRRRPLNFTTH